MASNILGPDKFVSGGKFAEAPSRKISEPEEPVADKRTAAESLVNSTTSLIIAANHAPAPKGDAVNERGDSQLMRLRK